MTNLMTITHNISNLIIPSIILGQATYFAFNHMDWWNPLISGVLYGLFTFFCILPLTINRLKEEGK